MCRLVEPVRLQQVAIDHNIPSVEQMAQRAAAVAQRAPDLQRRADHIVPTERVRHGEVVHDVDDLPAVELEPVALITEAEKYLDIGPAARRMKRCVTV